MKVLLTGGNGFVGSHVVERLLADQIPVVLLLRRGCDTAFIAKHLPVDPPDLQPKTEVRYGRLDDLAALRSALEGVTHVIHGAGATKGLRREDLFRVNQVGTRNLIQAVNDAGGQVQRLLYLSSLAAGRPGTRASPAREDDPPMPLSAYGESKRAAELELRNRSRCPFVILRPAGVYGPRDREFLRLFKAAAAGITPLFGGGRQELSLAFAPDLAEVMARALGAAAAAGQTLNVAGEEVVTSGELTRAVAAALEKRTLGLRLPNAVLDVVCLAAAGWASLTGQPTLLAHGKRRELTAPGWVADTSRLQDALGPVCLTRLKDGLTTTLAWYRENGWL